MMDVCGARHPVSDFCEQIAWLSAALRSSPHGDGVAIATPHVETPILATRGPEYAAHLICNISVSLSKVEAVAPIPGRCWSTMFRNPVMAAGFPTPVRPEPQMGLEMPLAMMTRLVHTNKIQQFDRSLFIKGFSSMLYPTRRTGTLIVWHHDYNAEGEHLSYSDHSAAVLDSVGIEHLDSAQHVIGWCQEVENCAGNVAVLIGTMDRLLNLSRL